MRHRPIASGSAPRSGELRSRQVDDFNPDVVVIWSKEQLENGFATDCDAAVCVYAYD